MSSVVWWIATFVLYTTLNLSSASSVGLPELSRVLGFASLESSEETQLTFPSGVHAVRVVKSKDGELGILRAQLSELEDAVGDGKRVVLRVQQIDGLGQKFRVVAQIGSRRIPVVSVGESEKSFYGIASEEIAERKKEQLEEGLAKLRELSNEGTLKERSVVSLSSLGVTLVVVLFFSLRIIPSFFSQYSSLLAAVEGAEQEYRKNARFKAATSEIRDSEEKEDVLKASLTLLQTERRGLRTTGAHISLLIAFTLIVGYLGILLSLSQLLLLRPYFLAWMTIGGGLLASSSQMLVQWVANLLMHPVRNLVFLLVKPRGEGVGFHRRRIREQTILRLLHEATETTLHYVIAFSIICVAPFGFWAALLITAALYGVFWRTGAVANVIATAQILKQDRASVGDIVGQPSLGYFYVVDISWSRFRGWDINLSEISIPPAAFSALENLTVGPTRVSLEFTLRPDIGSEGLELVAGEIKKLALELARSPEFVDFADPLEGPPAEFHHFERITREGAVLRVWVTVTDGFKRFELARATNRAVLKAANDLYDEGKVRYFPLCSSELLTLVPPAQSALV